MDSTVEKHKGVSSTMWTATWALHAAKTVFFGVDIVMEEVMTHASPCSSMTSDSSIYEVLFVARMGMLLKAALDLHAL